MEVYYRNIEYAGVEPPSRMISIVSMDDDSFNIAAGHGSILDRRSSIENAFEQEDSESSAISAYAVSEKSLRSNGSQASFNSGRTKLNVWSKNEDDLLRRIVGELGPKHWKNVAAIFNSKTRGKPREMSSIVEHWVRVLDPAKVSRKWTPSEDMLLLRAMLSCQPRQWSKIAQMMPGRSDNEIVSRLRSLRKNEDFRRALTDEYFP